MEYVFVFKNTNQVIKSERALLRCSIDVAVMPLPSQIGAGCGLGLRVGDRFLDSAKKIIEGQNICDYSVFLKTSENGVSVYSKAFV